MPNGIRRRDNRTGFTLIELLVVIGIIVILVGILLPVVASMRVKAQEADTRAQITRISQAINHYYNDFRAYPGPIPETSIYGNGGTTSQTVTFSSSSPTTTIVTSAENLVLGLLGGLVPPTTAGGGVSYQATMINQGPQSLNFLNPKAPTTYLDTTPAELSNNGGGTLTSWTTTPAGKDVPAVSGVPTTLTIPELMDHFSTPHPIIYLRAMIGGNSICDSARTATSSGSQYFTAELNPYWRVFTSTTNRSAGAVPTASAFSTPVTAGQPSTAQYPTATSFFQNTTLNDGVTPKSKDTYILISAGYDGIYGTQDDVMYTN